MPRRNRPKTMIMGRMASQVFTLDEEHTATSIDEEDIDYIEQRYSDGGTKLKLRPSFATSEELQGRQGGSNAGAPAGGLQRGMSLNDVLNTYNTDDDSSSSSSTSIEEPCENTRTSFNQQMITDMNDLKEFGKEDNNNEDEEDSIDIVPQTSADDVIDNPPRQLRPATTKFMYRPGLNRSMSGRTLSARKLDSFKMPKKPEDHLESTTKEGKYDRSAAAAGVATAAAAGAATAYGMNKQMSADTSNSTMNNVGTDTHHHTGKRGRELSAISKKYDTDGKGCLDSVQQAMRNYDVTNRGNLSAEEVKQIVKSQLNTKVKIRTYRKVIASLVCLVVILALSSLV